MVIYLKLKKPATPDFRRDVASSFILFSVYINRKTIAVPLLVLKINL